MKVRDFVGWGWLALGLVAFVVIVLSGFQTIDVTYYTRLRQQVIALENRVVALEKDLGHARNFCAGADGCIKIYNVNTAAGKLECRSCRWEEEKE